MSLPRILQSIFAAGVALAVAVTLVGSDDTVAQSGTVALLAAAAYVALLVRQPVSRWCLTAGLVLLAGAFFTGRQFAATLPIGPGMARADLGRYYAQLATQDRIEAVLLLLATVALTAGVVALPQFRRPVWWTAVACGVALIPVAVVAWDAAGESQVLLVLPRDTPGLLTHLAPGLAATVLAGLILVLAVSRADRWFLVPAGALLLQITAASLTRGMADTWYSRAPFGGPETAFLSPGYAWAIADRPSIEISAALIVAASLLGPGLVAAGAARTAAATQAP